VLKLSEMITEIKEIFLRVANKQATLSDQFFVMIMFWLIGSLILMIIYFLTTNQKNKQ